MHTRVVRPVVLQPEELDQYLMRGWYRIGQTMMTCRFVYFGNTLRSAIWTRRALGTYVPRRSHRRTLRRIQDRLVVDVVRPVLDEPHEAVYQRYRTTARGERSASLSEFLYGDREPRHHLFDTWEVRFRTPEGELVGFSWFDLGQAAIQSLVGVYDPAYADLSLGFGSMLFEMQWAKERDLEWFYPGYVLPGDDAMDYKLRVGAVEFLDDAGQWLPWSSFDPERIPTAQMQGRLDEAAACLVDRGLACTTQVYPMFEAPAWHANLATCMTEPLILTVPLPSPRSVLTITWDLERRAYRLRRCLRAAAVSRSVTDADDEGTPVELLVVIAEVATRDTAGAIAAAAEAEVSRSPY